MRFRLPILLFAALLALSGCDSSSRPDKAAAPASVAANGSAPGGDYGPSVRGGRYVDAMLADASNLISILSSDQSSHAMASYLYVAPLKYDKNYNIVPWAAESYEVLDGGKLLRFKLRQDIYWEDGVQLTADDVEFTYKLTIDPKTPTAYAGDFQTIKEFRKTGKFSFEVRYDKPFARSLITWMSDILPKHALEGQDLMTTPLARQPLSAGPYVLEKWDAGRSLVFRANEHYFLGRPNIDEIRVRIIPDQATQFLELKAGNLDIMNLDPQQYLYQTSGDDWKKYKKYKYLADGYTFLGYNLDSALFKDVRVRRALAHAIDKQEIIKGALFGLGLPAVGPYKPGTWVYNDAIKPYAYDPELAKRMLAEAGWTDSDGDGVLDKDGRPFSFTIICNQGNSQRLKIATIVQYRLAQIGIRTEIRTLEWATFLKEYVDKRRYDALILSWNILQDPDIYDVWHSSRTENGGLNFMGFRNAEVDDILEKARRSLDQDYRKKLYDRMQVILHEQQPYCFLYYPMSLPIVSARIQGIKPAPAGIGYNYTEWWIPKTLQRLQSEPR